MTSSELLHHLVVIFPSFATSWDATDNVFREEDGSYTVCGVFSQFSHFLRDNFCSLQPSAVSELGRLIEDCLAEPQTEVWNDAGACFLENMIAEEFTPTLVEHLGPRGRECIAELRGDAV